MLISHSQITALEANWGEKSEALDVYAWVKLQFGKSHPAHCYLYAKQPDEDYYLCLLGFPGGLNIVHIGMAELKILAESTGEIVMLDTEYRPRNAAEILKQNRRYINGRLENTAVATQEQNVTDTTS